MTAALLLFVAFAAGVAGSVAGLVVLVETHRDSPCLQRFAVGALVLLCVDVALDGFFCRPPSPVATAFAAGLAVHWSYQAREWSRGRHKQGSHK